MNRKLLITDIIIFALGLVMLCVIQLMMEFNPPLLTNKIVLISFAAVLIVFGVCIIMFSYKNNTESISAFNFVLHIVLAIIFYAFYSIPDFCFSKFNGVGNSVCIAFIGILCSRCAFSFSKYLKTSNTVKTIKANTYITVKPIYSKNMPGELHEAMNIVGFLFLIGSTIVLIYNTFNPYFNIAWPFG